MLVRHTHCCAVLCAVQTAEMEAELLSKLDGGFDASDFEIMQRLGRISVQQVGALGHNTITGLTPSDQLMGDHSNSISKW